MNLKIETYEFTDKVILMLSKQIARRFERAKSALMRVDELNVLGYCREMYDILRSEAFSAYLLLARTIYKKYLGAGVKGRITEKWLNDLLTEYDPITKYVYDHEVDRKMERLAEAVIASKDPTVEIERAMRAWSGMTNQIAIEVTDRAALKAYKDSGVERVIWLTHRDERRCAECKDLDGEIFDIEDVPPKPHIRCRCWVMQYFEED